MIGLRAQALIVWLQSLYTYLVWDCFLYRGREKRGLVLRRGQLRSNVKGLLSNTTKFWIDSHLWGFRRMEDNKHFGLKLGHNSQLLVIGTELLRQTCFVVRRPAFSLPLHYLTHRRSYLLQDLHKQRLQLLLLSHGAHLGNLSWK